MVGSSIFSGCQLKIGIASHQGHPYFFLRFLSAAFPPPIRLVVSAQPTVWLHNQLIPTQPTASQPCSFGRFCNLYHLLNRYSWISLNALCICSTLLPFRAWPSKAKFARNSIFILFSWASSRALSRLNRSMY